MAGIEEQGGGQGFIGEQEEHEAKEGDLHEEEEEKEEKEREDLHEEKEKEEEEGRQDAKES